ncbi:MAG: universal stress protein [Cyclobacteriaceae bacterium]|nr:universal stress protein [Cyclobacteriaceae bacterium]
MKTIFVSTDFSSTGNNAVKYAVQYALSTSSNLVVFHAVHMPKFSPTITEVGFQNLERKTEEIHHKKLQDLVDKIYLNLGLKRAGKKTKVIVKNGIFVMDTLLKAAKSHEADLIIVGTHGATGLKIFGSTTSELIFNSNTPVLAIPPRCRYKKMESMVYATDLKNVVSELRSIAPIAKKVKALIEVLYLDFGMIPNRPIIEPKDLMKHVQYKKIKVIVQKEKQGLSILAQIQRYLKNRRPEVLIMFPEERSLFDKLFVRSKTEELLYHTKLPLLTLRKSRVTNSN